MYLVYDFIINIYKTKFEAASFTPALQALQLSIEAHTGTPPAADWKRPPGRPRRNWLQQVEEDLAYLLVLPGSRARIVRCGGRYDPQLVKRSSE